MPNLNTLLTDRAISHAIYLNRFESQMVNELLPLIIKGERGAKEIFDAHLSKIMESGYTSPADSKRTERLIEVMVLAIMQLRNQESFKPFSESLRLALSDFADYESGFTVASANDEFKRELDGTGFMLSMQPIADGLAYDSAVAKPFSMQAGKSSTTLDQYLSGMHASEARRITEAVRNGVSNGLTTRDIVRSVWGTVKERETGSGSSAAMVTRRGAESLVRTVVTHVTSAARDEVYKKNDDLVKGVEWISTLDSRVTPICQLRDGNVYPIDSGPRPPAHFNAVCRGEMITTATGKKPIEQVAVGDLVLTHRGNLKPVTAVMRKPCDTNVVRVITMETGRKIRVTDEHPVLLNGFGWVRADALKVGDKLFQNVRQDEPILSGLSVIVGAPNNYPSIFDGDEVFFEVGIIPGDVAATINLDNDLVINKNKISNGSSHDNLAFVPSNTNGIKEINKILLSLRNVGKLLIPNSIQNAFKKFISFGGIVPLHSLRASSVNFGIVLVEPVSPMVLTHTIPSINSFLHFNRSNFGFRKSFYTEFFTPSTHGSVGESKFPLNLPETLFADNVMLVNEGFTEGFVSEFNHWVCSSVSDISIVAYEDDVYNLDVKDDHTYLVDDVVVHNCRSVTSPVLKTYRELGINVNEPAESTRAYFAIPAKMNVTQYRQKLRKEGLTRDQEDKIINSLSGQTDDPDFGSFLARQSKEFQETVLGKQRTELYRKGELTIKELISPQGKYYTLDELRQLQPDAFVKAGI